MKTKSKVAGDGECPVTVGFRLDPEHRRLLSDRAKTLGVSAHELARHYTLQSLHEGDERAEVRNAILALRQEMIELRKDIAVSTEVLLTSAGRVTAAESRIWARDNLKVD